MVNWSLLSGGIWVVERRKDGYESDVSDIEASDSLSIISPAKRDVEPIYRYSSDDSSADEKKSSKKKGYQGDKDFSPLSHQRKVSAFATERTTRQKALAQSVPQVDGGDSEVEVEDDDDVNTVVVRRRGGGFTATTGVTGPKKNKTPTKASSGGFTSARKFFGKDEDVYIMDAKSIGNIGRYLNHSCNPNVFVQNVFVDTHDLRFPWVAFFTSTFVRAGLELCWDYNYEVGAIPGKELFCSCGSDYCRGKLL